MHEVLPLPNEVLLISVYFTKYYKRPVLKPGGITSVNFNEVFNQHLNRRI